MTDQEKLATAAERIAYWHSEIVKLAREAEPEWDEIDLAAARLTWWRDVQKNPADYL